MEIEQTLWLWWQEIIEPPTSTRFAQFEPMPKESFNLKLARAREHLKAFDIYATAWIEAKPYKGIDEPDPEPPPQPVADGFYARRFRLYRIEPFPGWIGSILGDCLFNLRSCLDHLALALAKAFTPSLADDDITNSEFPIFDKSSGFQNQKGRKIGRIAPPAQAVIESLQPYHRGNAYATHPLWQIHSLNRIDKHRTLLICAAFPPNKFAWSIIPYNVETFGYFLPCSSTIDLRTTESDTILVRWSGMPSHPDREMRVKLGMPVAIFLGEGKLPDQPLVPLLDSLCDFVGNVVIAQLTKFL